MHGVSEETRRVVFKVAVAYTFEVALFGNPTRQRGKPVLWCPLADASGFQLPVRPQYEFRNSL